MKFPLSDPPLNVWHELIKENQLHVSGEAGRDLRLSYYALVATILPVLVAPCRLLARLLRKLSRDEVVELPDPFSTLIKFWKLDCKSVSEELDVVVPEFDVEVVPVVDVDDVSS